jgi:hypothetical protein
LAASRCHARDETRSWYFGRRHAPVEGEPQATEATHSDAGPRRPALVSCRQLVEEARDVPLSRCIHPAIRSTVESPEPGELLGRRSCKARRRASIAIGTLGECRRASGRSTS